MRNSKTHLRVFGRRGGNIRNRVLSEGRNGVFRATPSTSEAGTDDDPQSEHIGGYCDDSRTGSKRNSENSRKF